MDLFYLTIGKSAVTLLNLITYILMDTCRLLIYFGSLNLGLYASWRCRVWRDDGRSCDASVCPLQQHMTITTTLPRVKRLRRKKRVDNITGCPMSGSTIQNSKTAQCKFSKLNLWKDICIQRYESSERIPRW